MLPASYDDNAAYAVLADSRQGFHLLLVSKEMLDQPPPFVPLWVFECGDRRSMNAAGHWLAVRRRQWQAWGELAESHGQEAIALHMAKLMAEEPVGEVQGTIVQKERDPCVLSLGELLTSPTGMRRETLYQHRFATPVQRKQFFDWFTVNSNNGSVERLIEIGLKHGTLELAAALDQIARPLAARRKLHKAA